MKPDRFYRILFYILILSVWIGGCKPATATNSPTLPPPTEMTFATSLPTPAVTIMPSATPTALPPATATVEPSATPTTSPDATATSDSSGSTNITWKTYEFEQVQIALPATFQVLDVADFPIEVADGVVSEDCQGRLEEFELAIPVILLTAMDFSFSNDSLSVFMLTEESLPPATTLETTLERLEICDQYGIVEREIVEINGRQAGRIVTEVEADAFGFSLEQVAYLFQQDNRMWGIIYTFWPEDAETQLSVLQQIVESFTILSE